MKINQIIDKLNKNKILAINNGFTYELIAKNSLANKIKLYEIRQKPLKHRAKFIFESTSQIDEHISQKWSYINTLVNFLDPGTIFTINTENPLFQQKTSNIALASNDLLKEITKKCGPLISSPASLYGSPVITSKEMIIKYFPLVEIVTSTDLDGHVGIEPGVINCLAKNKVILENKLFFSEKTISKIIPSIEIITDYKKYNYRYKNLNIKYISKKSQLSPSSMVLGTRESLKSQFGELPKFFHTSNIDNINILNLGSETSPKIIIKNFHKNLHHSIEAGYSEIAIFQPTKLNSNNKYLNTFELLINKFATREL